MKNRWSTKKIDDHHESNSVVATTITKTKTKTAIMTTSLILASAIIASPLLLSNALNAQAQSLAGTTFPPPVFNTIRSQPAYVVNIPFSSEGKAVFEPKEISIPTGMTVIWFNNDEGQHTVTTISNSSYSPPAAFDSGGILGSGGSFINQFNTPGKYLYSDQFNPSVHGIVNVGSAVEQGKNFNMYVGGISSLPFNANKSQSVVLSFVPKTVKFPPVISLTYNVTLLDSTGKPLYSHTYDDSDGILDLEIVPIHKNIQSGSNTATLATSQKQFTTWGPDFIGQEEFNADGVFHISGPILVQNSPYSVAVSIVASSNRDLPHPISETFALPAVTGGQ
jgi:plastocyanin